jgi:hypothetical protein
VTEQWLGDRVGEVRALMTPEDEASLWTMFFQHPRGEPVIVNAIHGAMNEPDTSWLANFTRILERVGAAAHLFVVIRNDGRPRVCDQRLWCRLQRLPHGSHGSQLGLIVVGPATWWCAPRPGAPDAA